MAFNLSAAGIVLRRDRRGEFRTAGETTMKTNPSLRQTDATFMEIRRIVRSAEGRKAAIDATRNALPALSGVDPLLRAKLGDRYRKTDRGTASAGALVAEVMHELGFNAGTRKPCVGDTVARSGILWTLPKPDFADRYSRNGDPAEARCSPDPRTPECHISAPRAIGRDDV
jgi:hypothetical protein